MITRQKLKFYVGFFTDVLAFALIFAGAVFALICL